MTQLTRIKNTKVFKRRGIAFSFMETIPYALIPLILLIQYTVPAGTIINSEQGVSFARGIVNSFANDLWSLIFLPVYIGVLLVTKRYSEIQTFGGLFKTRAGVYAMVAGIFGGPIGYTLFNTAFYLAGPSFGQIFTSVEPVLVALIAYFFWKRKFKWQMWLGVGLTVAALITLVAGSAFTSEVNAGNIILGAALGVGGALAWAIESILFDRASERRPEVSSIHFVNLKIIASNFFLLVIMMPVGGAIAANDPSLTYVFFGQIFTRADWIGRFIGAGILIIIGRLMFFEAVKLQGATFVNVVYQLANFLTPIFALIWFGLSGSYLGAEGTQMADGSIGLPGSRYLIVLFVAATASTIASMLVTLYRTHLPRNADDAISSDEEQIDPFVKMYRSIKKVFTRK